MARSSSVIRAGRAQAERLTNGCATKAPPNLPGHRQATQLDAGRRLGAQLYREIAASAVILILTKKLVRKEMVLRHSSGAALGKAISPSTRPTGEAFVSPTSASRLGQDPEGGLERLGSELTRLALNARGTFPWEKSGRRFPGCLHSVKPMRRIYSAATDDIRG